MLLYSGEQTVFNVLVKRWASIPKTKGSNRAEAVQIFHDDQCGLHSDQHRRMTSKNLTQQNH